MTDLNLTERQIRQQMENGAPTYVDAEIVLSLIAELREAESRLRLYDELRERLVKASQDEHFNRLA